MTWPHGSAWTATLVVDEPRQLGYTCFVSETGYTRKTALAEVDKVRATLEHSESNALAGVVRDLWDGYPVADARSSLRAAEYKLPYEVYIQLRIVLDATADEEN